MASEQTTQWSAYFGRSPALSGLGLRCLGIGVQSGRMAGVVDRVLDQYALVYVESGRGRLVSGSGEVVIMPGTLFWLAPGERHSYGPDGRGWRERWLLFDGPAARVYQRLGLISTPVQQPSGHRQLLDGFARISALAAQRTMLAQAEMAVILQEMILATGSPVRSTAQADDHQLVERARDLATSNMTVERIADRLDVSVRELRRAVRAEAGVGVKTYLLSARMEIAQSMLADGDEPVSAVARRCGYDDPGYFSRAFTGYVGLSPTRFRAQQRRRSRGA